MLFFYNILVYLAKGILSVISLFDNKIKLFVEGRKDSISIIRTKISKNDKVIWVHCASLGEFEQGRPIIEALKKEFPSKKIALTFFSPSGYEIRKTYELADVVCYLPYDTKNEVSIFLKYLQPEIAIFVKYEFWPQLVTQLKEYSTKTILVSGIFRKDQLFFKRYGKSFRKLLQTFDHFFVQDENSKVLLETIGFYNCTVSGDTRFDRVFKITHQNNTLDFVENFKQNTFTLVAGSTWKEDEELLISYINKNENEFKFIIAPHNIDEKEILELKKSIRKKSILFTEINNQDISEYDVLIINTIGILTKIYSYANVAYVGGGYTKSGVHNILEPATFGIPILIGPNFKKFKEVNELVALGGCFVADNLEKVTQHLKNYSKFNQESIPEGKIASEYIKNNIGATTKIINYLKK